MLQLLLKHQPKQLKLLDQLQVNVIEMQLYSMIISLFYHFFNLTMILFTTYRIKSSRFTIYNPT